jgi:hypothetical protein
MTCNVKKKREASHRNLGIVERTDSDAAVLAWSLTGLVASKKAGALGESRGGQAATSMGGVSGKDLATDSSRASNTKSPDDNEY